MIAAKRAIRSGSAIRVKRGTVLPCHAAGWNVPDHGVRNVSHGCVNMNPADAQWLYSTFTVGDVVEVKGTPVPLPVGDGLGDWAVPFGQYGS